MAHSERAALAAALLALLALAPMAAGEGGARFPESYQVRGALGDIPTTQQAEPQGWWNVEETVHFATSSDAGVNITLTLPPGAAPSGDECTCGAYNLSWSGARATLSLEPTAEPANHSFVFRHRVAVAPGDTFSFVFPDVPEELRADAILLFYLPDRYVLTGPFEADFELPSTSENPGLLIYGYSGSAARPLPSALSFSTAIDERSTLAPREEEPAAAAPVAVAPMVEPDAWWRGALLPVAAAVAGVVVGALVMDRTWLRLGGRAEPPEPKETLAARKLALVGALQALEAARADGRVDETAYAAVHSELKDDALATMQELQGRGEA